jgi:hypothetical protein
VQGGGGRRVSSRVYRRRRRRGEEEGREREGGVNTHRVVSTSEIRGVKVLPAPAQLVEFAHGV